MPSLLRPRPAAKPSAVRARAWLGPYGRMVESFLPFGEGDGTTARNVVALDYPFTLAAGTTWTAGQFGSAIRFDGATDVQVNTGTGLPGAANSVGFAGWVYLPSTSTNGCAFSYGSQIGIGVGSGTFDSVGNEVIVLYDSVRWVATGVSYGRAGWHHVGFRTDGSGFPAIYLNGRRIYSDTTGGHNSADGTRRVGSDNASRYWPSGAKLDLPVWWRDWVAPDDFFAFLYANPLGPPLWTPHVWPTAPSGGTPATKDAAGRLRLRPGGSSRPAADVSIGNWTTNTGATTNLYATLDETTPDDTDYIQSGTTPVNDTAILTLQPLADAGTTQGLRVRLRLGKSVNGAQMDLTATLQAGTTDVATATFTDVAAGVAEVQFALTAAEVATFRSNGGFADPRLKIVATQV